MAPGQAAADRVVTAIAGRCARAQDPLDLLEQVATLLRRRVPYDAAGWILVDPHTMLMNAVYAEDVDRAAHLALIAAEQSDEADVNRFVDLARAGVAAASLHAATDGDLASSPRWRAVYRPRGYGDELRAVFTGGSVTWGYACLTRTAEHPAYDASEVALVARACPHLAHGIRTGLAMSDQPGSAPGAPGLVVLTDDGSVESMTPAVTEWFGDLENPSLRTTIVLHEVAHRARLLAEEAHPGSSPEPGPARAVARTCAGESVVVRGTRLEGEVGRTALVIDPPHRTDVAPLLMHLHQLTAREREVTGLLLSGLSTKDIASDLWISQETLRGHVKAVLAKMEVSSRAELFAKLSPEPRSRRRPVAPDGRRTR